MLMRPAGPRHGAAGTAHRAALLHRDDRIVAVRDLGHQVDVQRLDEAHVDHRRVDALGSGEGGWSSVPKARIAMRWPRRAPCGGSRPAERDLGHLACTCVPMPLPRG